MGREEFINELKLLGYEPEVRNGNQVAFRYTIPVGKFAGRAIWLGFDVSGDFPLNPPGGPHVSPHLMPSNTNAGAHPNCGIHASSFGNEWQYWSRPFPNWSATNRTARVYMAHIRHLFDTL